MSVSDIKDVAVSVNDRLKKLITPEDDGDYMTDITATSDPQTTPILRRGVPSTITPSPNSPQSQVTSISSAPLTTSTPSPLTFSPSHTSTGGPREAQDTPAAPGKQDSAKTGRTIAKPGGQSPNLSRKSDTGVESGGVREEGGEGKGEEGGGTQLSEPKLHLLAVLGVLIPHMKYTLPETRMETLRWLMWLHQQLPKRVSLLTHYFGLI